MTRKSHNVCLYGDEHVFNGNLGKELFDVERSAVIKLILCLDIMVAVIVRMTNKVVGFE